MIKYFTLECALSFMTHTEPVSSMQWLWKVASWVELSLSEPNSRYIFVADTWKVTAYQLINIAAYTLATWPFTIFYFAKRAASKNVKFFHIFLTTLHIRMFLCICMCICAYVLRSQVDPSHHHVFAPLATFATVATLLQSRRLAVRVLVSISLRPIKIHATSSWQVINFHFRCATAVALTFLALLFMTLF